MRSVPQQWKQPNQVQYDTRACHGQRITHNVRPEGDVWCCGVLTVVQAWGSGPWGVRVGFHADAALVVR
jgi:hypothetical protein